MKLMISACLMGQNCKYNGGNNRNEFALPPKMKSSQSARKSWAGCRHQGFRPSSGAEE